MGWQLTGRMHELCNCDFLCPCWFDLTAEPDQGHCKSGLVMDVSTGHADDVDLSGRKVVLGVSFPHTFAEGNATVRLFVDSGTTEEQQDALENIFQGRRGGAFEAVAPIIAETLPTIKTDIDIEWGETPKIHIGDVVDVQSTPAMDPAGTPTKVSGAQAMAAFQLAEGQPARPNVSMWNDPDIGAWEPRSGMVTEFNWSA